MATATEETFHTNELLEIILLLLSVKDIVNATAVSRRFRNTIRSSAKLQRKLFLVPSPDDSTFITNSLVLQMFPIGQTIPYENRDIQDKDLPQVFRRSIRLILDPQACAWDMYLARPPIKKASVSNVDSGNPMAQLHNRPWIAQREDGLRLRDLMMDSRKLDANGLEEGEMLDLDLEVVLMFPEDAIVDGPALQQ